MPELIPLYPKPPLAPVEVEKPLGLDLDCKACPRRGKPCSDHKEWKRDWDAGEKRIEPYVPKVVKGETAVVGPVADAAARLRGAGVVEQAGAATQDGTLLVVGEAASRDEDVEGRPFVGRPGHLLRPLLRRFWSGTVVLDLAARCWSGRGKAKIELEEEQLDACRPYLAATVSEAKPDRIICLGPAAAYSVLGRMVYPLNSRRGYSWLWNDGYPVPVFFVLNPSHAVRNRFLRRYFEEDLAWALTVDLRPPSQMQPEFSATMVTTPADAEAACADLMRGEGFAFDLEWAGYQWDPDFRVMAMACSPVGRDSVWVWDEGAIADPARWGPIEKLLVDPDVPKGGSNVKSDQHALWCGKSVRVRGISFDTRLERKMLEPDATANLEDMAELVGMGGHKAEVDVALSIIDARVKVWAKDQRGAKKQKQSGFEFADAVDAAARLGFDMTKYSEHPRAVSFAFLEKQMLHRYVARDALSTARLRSKFTHDLMKAPHQQKMMDKIVLPASTAIQRVEEWGVPYDRGAGLLFHDMMKQQQDAAYAAVQQYAEAGRELNPGSPQQLGRILYDKLRLKPPHETDSGAPSTDEEALGILRDTSGHPLPGLILQYRHYQKLVGYADDWARCVRTDDRIHPSIKLDGARSGRTSCSDPNLQNIPRAADSADGKAARDCFVAPPGYVLVQLDYSQLELRIAALISRDDVMAELFKSGVDFHLGTAKLISQLAWGIPPEQVGKPHRTGAKAFNFGIAYGKTDRSLAYELGIEVERAAQIRAAIFGKFVRYGVWCREAIGEARDIGGCWTYWEGERARFRPLWRIADESEEGKFAASKAKNGAINTPIQGTASDFCVASISKLVDAHDRGELNAEVILPVHDSIMLLAPENDWQSAARTARDAMQTYPWCTDFVPLEVDIEVGTKWGSLEKAELN